MLSKIAQISKNMKGEKNLYNGNQASLNALKNQ